MVPAPPRAYPRGMRSLAYLLLAACGASPSNSGPDAASPRDGRGPAAGSVFDPAFTNVTVEIDYETGQEPYTGQVIGFGDTFDTVTANLDRLLASKKTLTIPRTTAGMEDIGNIPDEALTTTDILAIANAHRNLHDTATTKAYYVVFLSGHYADDSGEQPGVIGVSIGNTGILAMFKDVIRSTDVVGTMNVARYVEQSTLVHELGHQFGLVNNGLLMVAPHEDTGHPAHCTNDQCAMYWANEGTTNAARFAQEHVLTGSSILFGAECLADADAVNGK